jgi:CNT family concentrative nucleoside transporter
MQAPLTVRPFIEGMTRSQIMAVMTGGFATIAGSVLAAYVGILGGEGEESRILFAKHLLTASIMLCGRRVRHGQDHDARDRGCPPRTSIDSVATGSPPAMSSMPPRPGRRTVCGLPPTSGPCSWPSSRQIAMVNWPLSYLGVVIGVEGLSLQRLLGWVFMPVAWCMGVGCGPRRVCAAPGQQIVATEFVADLDLSRHIREGSMDARSCQIATYALCGFANLPSIAIQIGGLSATARSRRSDFASIAPGDGRRRAAVDDGRGGGVVHLTLRHRSIAARWRPMAARGVGRVARQAHQS